MKFNLRKAFSVILAAGMAVSMLGTPVSAGWVQKGEDYYYENADGSYKTGWIKTKSGDYYYCLKSGKRAHNCTVKIGGVSYKFDKNGKAVNKPKENSSSSKKSDSSKATTGQKNALKSAERYLAIMSFSYESLVKQLEFEGFTHSQAVYGAKKAY